MSTHAHYKDLIGSELRLNNRTYLRSASTRRGIVTGVGNGLDQKSLYDIAADIKTELGGNYHPQATSLPLQNISLRRIGADRCEYVAEYGHYDQGINADWGVSIVGGEYSEPYTTGFATEAASGMRWSPNEIPPSYSLRVPAWSVRRAVTMTSTASVNTIMGLAYPLVNNASITIAGITFGAYRLRLNGVQIAFDSAAIGDGVKLVYDFTYRGVAMAYPPGDPNGSLVYATFERFRYRRLQQRPYWELEAIPEGPAYNFSTLPGI